MEQKFLPWLLVIFQLVVTGCSNRNRDTERVTNQIIIKFKEDVRQTSIDSLVQQLGLKQVSEVRQLGVKVYQLPANLTVEAAIEKCQQEAHVEYVEPDYVVTIRKKEQKER